MLNRRTVTAIAALLAMLGCGALGFVLVEGYTWPEGVYMAVITVTTVGFGEIRPLSAAGRAFTTVYTLLSFLSVAVLLHSLVASMLDTVLRRDREGAKMKKAIAAMSSHYILCGHGRLGKAAVWPFEAAGLDFVVIEADPHECDVLRAAGTPVVEGDSTHVSTLREAGIERALGLIAMLDSDPHNLYIVLTARELNPDLHIIARVEEAGSESRTMRAGADSVVSPFMTAGCAIGNSMIESTRRKQRESAAVADPVADPAAIPTERATTG